MAATGTPTQRRTRAGAVSSPTPKSKETTARSARGKGATGLNGAPKDGDSEEELVAVGTPSRRGRPTRAQATTTPIGMAPLSTTDGSPTTPASRKRKAAEMLGRTNGKSPELEESIVVDDVSTRSSGRARKKTTKLAEMEVPKKTKTPTKRIEDMVAKTPKKTPKAATKSSAKVSSAKRRQKKPEPTQQEEEPVAEAPQAAEPVIEQPVVDTTVEQLDTMSTPGTTPRKRGRPKGSKNKKTLAKALADPPFENISITPNSKARKLALEAKAAQDAANAAIDAEARALEEKAKLLEQSADLLHDEAPLVPIEPQPTSNEPQPSWNTLVELLKKPAHAKAYDALREEIILRLGGKKLTPLVGVEQEYDQVRSLIRQTVAAGEGNSMLVIGGRGSGKTTLVETALAEVSVLHGDEFHVIRLNGFVYTDDKVALKEIWRQLGKEMQLSDSENVARSNYADTLASLLAVLSHPAEITGDAATQQTSQAVIFVLDEFDLFTSHPRQTLLYNLFDIAQSRKAPIAVLGLTTKIDVLEALEKRVKSRFSHRYVHLPAARTYATFLAVVKAALHCDLAEEFAPPSSAPISSSLTKSPAHKALLAAWTAHIDAALFTEPWAAHLRRVYAHSKSIPQVLTNLLPALLTSTASTPPSAARFASSSSRLAGPDNKLCILPSLSDAQLALLISAARLDIILATDAVNFLLAHDEYSKLALRSKVSSSSSFGAGMGLGLRIWGRDVLLAAWEALASKSLLVPVLGNDLSSRPAAAAAADAARRGRLYRVDVSLEEIARFLGAALASSAAASAASAGLGVAAGAGAAAGVYREMERWCRTI